MVESSSSPSANKRSRDPATEDEAYLDNFHSHKRYLSEIMASSLNGLTVGESMPQNVLESPARSETMSYLSQHNPAEESLAASESDSTKPPCRRDDVSLQYSPMSEDSDDAQYSETPINASIAASDSLSTSQSSPHRHQRLPNGAMVTSYPSISCNLTAVACSQPRQRGSDSEGRFPSSPSDICHSPDLRRAALLRSVQMRVQPPAPPSYDLPSSREQESMHNMEAEDHPCSCGKSLVDECVCQDQQQSSNLFAEECSSIKVPESELSRENPRKLLDMNVKEESCEEAFESSFGRHDLMTSRRSILGEDLKSRLDSNK